MTDKLLKETQELVAAAINDIAPELADALKSAEDGKARLSIGVAYTIVTVAGRPPRVFLKAAASFSKRERVESEASFELDDPNQQKMEV